MKAFQFALVFLMLSLLSCRKSDSGFVNNPGGADELHNKPVGASAKDLLTAGTYTSLRIEIQYMPGYAPDAAAVSHLQAFLGTYLNKPSGITIVTKEIPAGPGPNYSIDQVRQIENNNRTAFTSSGQIAVYVLYTNGNYNQNGVIGVAYRNTSVALMGKTIHDNSGALGQASRTKLEATVLEHELGHLLGLVDLGTPMQVNHEDPSHGSHCMNNNCLMFYASETTDILGFLLTGNIPSPDADCVADLRANGGK